MSASRSSSSAVVPCSGNTATPTLARTWSGEPGHLERRRQRVADAAPDLTDVARRRSWRVDEDGELIASEPRDLVASAQRTAKPRADLPQERIARRMTERVVDLLEAVEIEEQDGDAGIATCDRLAEAREEAASIEQAGELVVICLEAAFVSSAARAGEERGRDQHADRGRENDQARGENRGPLRIRASHLGRCDRARERAAHLVERRIDSFSSMVFADGTSLFRSAESSILTARA